MIHFKTEHTKTTLSIQLSRLESTELMIYKRRRLCIIYITQKKKIIVHGKSHINLLETSLCSNQWCKSLAPPSNRRLSIRRYVLGYLHVRIWTYISLYQLRSSFSVSTDVGQAFLEYGTVAEESLALPSGKLCCTRGPYANVNHLFCKINHKIGLNMACPGEHPQHRPRRQNHCLTFTVAKSMTWWSAYNVVQKYLHVQFVSSSRIQGDATAPCNMSWHVHV